MTGYVVRRLLLLVPVLLGVSVLVFAAVRLIPGDPAVALAGENATADYIAAVRHDLGLDRPIPEQYVIYVGGLLRGDLGRSTRSRAPVMSEIAARYPATLQLAAASTGVAVALGFSLGALAALRPRSTLDHAAMVVALLGLSMPVFWLGLVLVMVFAVGLHWLPAGGAGGPQYLVLPALTQGAVGAALIARMTRATMLEALRGDYVRTARAKGLDERLVVFRHALRNALIPILTVVGLQVGYLLGGTVLTECVFAWPGLGKMLVDAILTRDYPLIQGALLLFATSFALVNLAVDLLYGIIDPRIRYG